MSDNGSSHMHGDTARPAWLTAAACVAGVLAGVAYTLSPMTIWFAAATAALFAVAGRGVQPRERRWVFGLLSVALVARLLVLVAFFFADYRVDGSLSVLIGDESQIQRKAQWLINNAIGIPIAPDDYPALYGTYAESGLVSVLAYLQLLLGRGTYAIRLFSVLAYVSAAIILYRTVRPSFGAPAALGGLAVVLFIPSLFIWSIAAIKEPAYLLMNALSIAAAAAMLRANSLPGRLAALTACVVAVLGAGTLRATGEIMTAGGIAGGLLLSAAIRRPRLGAALLLVGVIVAYASYDRAAPRLQAVGTEWFNQAVSSHIGHVQTPGWTYKLLDADFYPPQPEWRPSQMPGDAIGRYLIRAAASIVLVPLPWRAASPSAVLYLPEQVVWYVLVLLAGVGAVVGVRRDAALTFMLCALVVTSGAVVALTSGNVGTMVRHRSMVMMPVVWLGALGACALVQQFAARAGSRPGGQAPDVVGA